MISVGAVTGKGFITCLQHPMCCERLNWDGVTDPSLVINNHFYRVHGDQELYEFNSVNGWICREV